MVFTILIIDNRKTYENFEAYRFIFQPYIAAGKMAICLWNEDGDRVETALPRLKELTRDRDTWRAIVVNPDGFNEEYQKVMRSQNPFDYSEIDKEDGPHESPIPLVRLTHILGGYPSTPPKTFEEAFECYEKSENDDWDDGWNDDWSSQTFEHALKSQTLRHDELTEEDREKYTLKSIYIETRHHEDILKGYQELAQKYDSLISKPCEILLTGLRHYYPNDKLRLEEVWKKPHESASSAFCERNKYPGNCRFLFAEPTHYDETHLQKLYAEFWLSVLTLALNRVPSATLQAYRLYRLGIDIDLRKLDDALNTQLDKLESVKQYLTQKRAALPEFTLKSSSNILERQEIKVLTETSDEKEDYANNIDKGSKNVVAHGAFQTDRSEIAQMASMLKDPRRAIERAARTVRRKADGFLGEQILLDEFQYHDLIQETAELEKKVFSIRPRNTFDRNSVQKSKADYQKANHNMPKSAMTMQEQIVLMLVAVGLALCGFIPYFIGLTDSSPLTFFLGLIICVIVLAVTAFGGSLALIPFKHQVEDQILKNDKIIHKEFDKRVAIEKKFGNHFTNICTYMKAQALISGACIGQDEAQLKRHQYFNDLRITDSVIEKLENWMAHFRIERVPETKTNIENFFNESLPMQDNHIFWLPISGEDTKIPLNTSGHKIDTPFEFVTRLTIAREEIFDTNNDGEQP